MNQTLWRRTYNKKRKLCTKKAKKTIFDKARNPKDKQPLKFMHCSLYLKNYPQWFYRDLAKGVQNIPNKRRVVDIDLIVGGKVKRDKAQVEVQLVNYNDHKDKKNAKTTRMNQDLQMAALKSVAEAFKHMSESSADKSRDFVMLMMMHYRSSWPTTWYNISSIFQIKRRAILFGAAKTRDKIADITSMFSPNTCSEYCKWDGRRSRKRIQSIWHTWFECWCGWLLNRTVWYVFLFDPQIIIFILFFSILWAKFNIKCMNVHLFFKLISNFSELLILNAKFSSK